MTDDSEGKPSDCTEFKKRVAENFELGSAVFIDPHLLSCSSCRELVEDLLRICEEARDYYWRHG